MNPHAPAVRSPAPATRATGPHLLDAATYWTPCGGSGLDRVLSAKRNLFTAGGWRHTLLGPGATGSGQLDCGGWRLPASGGCRFPLDRNRAARLIEQAEPDIIEAADPFTLGWAAIDAAKRLKVPAVAFCHAHLPGQMARLIGGSDGASTARGRWAERNARAYLADLYARFDLVLAPSRSMTRQLHDWGVWQAVRQPLGVDCSVFSPRAYDASWRARLEQQLGLAHGVRLFVYVGSFGADKNLAMLADAVQRLGPAHALLAVGSGPCPPVGAHVRLLPAQDDPQSLARLLASCDVFVHAGDHETFGLSALEAMACGTPLVVSHAGGHSELVEGAALTVSSRSAEQWAEAMAATLADPHSSLSWTALERARAYDWPQIVVQLAGRYRQAIRAVRPVEQSRATLMPAA